MRLPMKTLVLVLFLVSAEAFAEIGKADVVKVGTTQAQVPAWARKELGAFAAIEECYQDFMQRFVRADGSTVVTENLHHGIIDDAIEGFFKWDKFLLLAASDDLREKYMRVWKYHWRFGTEKGWFANGFYVKGYDAEHAGELLPLLWACVELAPDDKELVATNKAVAEVLISEEWFHPSNHLFRYSWVRSMPIDQRWRESWLSRWQGESAVNTLYVSGVWLAYLTSGEEKYRQWVLNYCNAWNRAARMNNGIFPYQIDTETMKLGPGGDGRWWKGTERTASFDFERYGTVVASRGWRNLPVAAAFLDRGNPAYAQGLVSTVQAMCANRENGLPCPAYSPEKGGWYRGKRWPHHIPTLLDRAYVLTWDPSLAKLMAEYPVEKASWLETQFANWCNFTYNRMGDLTRAEAAFEHAASGAKSRMRKAADAKPITGDDLTGASLHRLGDLDYVDGAQWAGHNARNGGPSPGPVGYFDTSGRRGLPQGMAALVRHTGRDVVELLVCNTRSVPVRLLVTGGYYGQHRIDLLKSGGAEKRIDACRVVLELAPDSVAEVTLTLTRCAYQPTLKPQIESPRSWRQSAK